MFALHKSLQALNHKSTGFWLEIVLLQSRTGHWEAVKFALGGVAGGFMIHVVSQRHNAA